MASATTLLPDYVMVKEYSVLAAKLAMIEERLATLERSEWVEHMESGQVTWNFKDDLNMKASEFDKVYVGEPRSKTVIFSRSFKKLPKVVIALQDFRSNNEDYQAEMRFEVSPISTKGFTVSYTPTAGRKARWWTVNWLAYESKESHT